MKRVLLVALVAISLVAVNAYGDEEADTKTGPLEVRAAKRAPGHLLITPRGYETDRAYPLFVFVHGLGSCPRCVLDGFRNILTQQDFFILIPEGPIKYEEGFSWYRLTDLKTFVRDAEQGEALIKELVAKVMDRYNIDRSRIVLSGFSQGGRLSFFVGFRNPHVFSEIMPIAGAYMDTLLDAYVKGARSLKVRIFHGTQDSVNSFAAMQSCYRKLRDLGFQVSLTTYSLGHTYTAEVLSEVLRRVR